MKKFRIILFFVFLFFVACAKIIRPAGGPVDDSSPEIINISPLAGSVNTIPTEIVISFSEEIQLSEKDIQLYPSLFDQIQIDIKKKEIVIHIENDENFDSNIFLVTLSSNITDARGNNLQNPITYAWNSAPIDSFSQAEIEVFRIGGGNVTSNARCDFFLLPDTISPEITFFPDSNAVVRANWILPGEYIIECYEDNDLSRTWDSEREPGDTQRYSLLPGEFNQFSMNMTIIDSIGPIVSEIRVIDNFHLELLWNEQIMKTDLISNQNVSILSSDSLPVYVYGVQPFSGRSNTGRLTVYTEQLSDTSYTLTVENIEDLNGNPSLPDTLEFWGTDSLPKTTFVVQSAFPSDGGIDIPPTGPFTISFSDWVDFDQLQPLYHVVRVSDSTEVKGVLTRTSPVAFLFTPNNDLLGNRQYRVDLFSGLTSLRNDSIASSSWTFTPAWSENPGFISGNISGTSSSVVKMVITPAGSDSETIIATFTPGEYLASDIAGGRYTVAIFVDSNGDNIWSNGEPYGAWPGVIDVFPGIITENIDIMILP